MRYKPTKGWKPQPIPAGVGALKTQRLYLANQAQRLHYAWNLLIAIAGVGNFGSEIDLSIPDYVGWNVEALRKQISDLEYDLAEIAQYCFREPKRVEAPDAVEWLASEFETWIKSQQTYYDLGRVHEVEQLLGPLCHRDRIDCPPYGQVFLNGFWGAAIRHPEYHLGTDLALAYNLFLDSEAFLADPSTVELLGSTQHSQSLGRSVILTCFNLLESFVNGLATGYFIENPGTSGGVKKQLEDKNAPLRKRLLAFPGIVAGTGQLLGGSTPPIQPLFEGSKRQRDSFEHCEAGSTPTKYGYVKEEHFHDITAKNVTDAVDNTCATICLAWKLATGRERPTWLPNKDADGRFPKVAFSLSLTKEEPKSNPEAM